ncbi:DNA-binding MarR family transcriptional regulator [Streptomyces pratensis]|nr:DNA-binding MarR family transcriptional regulator [Streptomyces pratensis]
MNDYEILVNLSESDDRRMRMSDLAAATLQSKSRLSHQITRMENAGLVRREHCESDRRGLFAVLTDLGGETMRKVAPHHVESVRRHFMDLLSPGELSELHAALTPIAEHLRGRRGKP